MKYSKQIYSSKERTAYEQIFLYKYFQQNYGVKKFKKSPFAVTKQVKDVEASFSFQASKIGFWRKQQLLFSRCFD